MGPAVVVGVVVVAETVVVVDRGTVVEGAAVVVEVTVVVGEVMAGGGSGGLQAVETSARTIGIVNSTPLCAFLTCPPISSGFSKRFGTEMPTLG